MAVEVELFDDLDAVARDAGGALDRAATARLFDRLDWYRLTLAHCPPAGRPLVARAAAGTDRAWLFFAAEGKRAQALASWYTLDYRPIVQAAEPDRLLTAITRALRGRLATVALGPMSDPVRTEAAFRSGGWWVEREAVTGNSRVRTTGRDFDAYWAARPARLRATVRRKAAKAGLEVRLLRHFDDEAWNAYEEVYARSWKPAEGSPAFLRALAQQEGAAGTLRLGVARVGGRAVAAQLWLVENGRATIHKLAHVADADALSPGTLLTAEMFRAVIDGDRPDWIDFGTGDDPYKADWMDERRPLYRLSMRDPASLLGLASAGRAAAAALVRPLRSR